MRQCHTNSGPWSEEKATRAMQGTFRETESALLEAALSRDWMDGTTAAVVAVLEDSDAGLNLLAANVGDSEIVVGWRKVGEAPQYTLLSELHAIAKNEAERMRVQAAGGQISHNRLGHPKFPRVASLAVSRALGDLFFKDAESTGGLNSGLSADPFVVYRQLTRYDCFVLLGCDGFFDGAKYQEAVDFVFARMDDGDEAQSVSEALVELARSHGSEDNITVQLVMLNEEA